ncbi:MAG: ribosomal protein S12 methylthiotransferase RimO [Candidatus Reconcilbacillus cellulovorans]|uniref:Ribosomal protein uS12 methylthiotransferase RimO n=1 Tax=Candidatus Reconcilbacillus cellulovorans TaxID=1906605 RepID=A0A2A6E0R3_9BACL|nr:MAG: ribosomal protein S12 methylthiotransferase RimO [Candidatus Reconcilbacillus cellulovorans]
MEKVKLVTLGCEKNLVDSEIMEGLLHRHGHQPVKHLREATVVVVNTCGFIDAAKEESVQTILELAELKQKGKLKALIVAGCLVQRYKDELMREIPEIDGIIGTGEFDRIAEIVDAALAGGKPSFVGHPAFNYDRLLPRRLSGPRHSVYVKIAEGCDNGCTFCSIPLMRGAFRSRSVESIVAEVESLCAQGAKEINLIAQDSTNYGRDLYGRLMLPELLNRIGEIPGVRWIRLHYAYPGFFTDELIDTIASNPKICKYVDMPLQHCVDRILRRMRRPGRERDIRELIDKIRERIPDVALRTSFIVGFPGETEEDFERLVSFVREIKFDRLGVFAYSREEGTPAARLPDQVPEDIKERRQAELMEVQREIAAERNARFVGRELDVIVDRFDRKNGVYVGRTQYDAPEVDGEVFVSGLDRAAIGDIRKVRITHSLEFDLAGEGVA